MNLYDILTTHYTFDETTAVFYRKSSKGLVALHPTGSSRTITIQGNKYKYLELVYLLKDPTYVIGSSRVLAVDPFKATPETVILKNCLITIDNYKNYYYYDEQANLFRRRYCFKGVNVADSPLQEVRNASNSLTVILDKDVEISKATLVWHWYTNQHIKDNTARFIFNDGNNDNTSISNLTLNTTSSLTSNTISSIRLQRMFTYTTAGVLVPKYSTNVFITNGYGVLSLFNHTVGIHRILYALYHNEPLLLKNPDQEIDHIDHNRQNNTIQNLRKVDSYLNKRNRSLSKHNTSGYNGIALSGSKFRVEIAGNYLGMFTSLEEAITARDAYTSANEYHHNHGYNI